MDNYVLSIGAGKEQLPSILKAQELGLKVLAVDKESSSPGMMQSDLQLHVDIKDARKVLKEIKKLNINLLGIIPSPIGRYLTTVGFINDSLNLNGVSEESALNCVDKFRFNNVLKTVFNNRIFFELIKNQEDYNEIIKKIEYPVILKPRYGSGSRGLFVLLNLDEAYAARFKIDFEEDYIMESLVEGKEYGVDAVIKDGEFSIVLIREKEITSLPFRQAVAINGPACFKADLNERIEKEIEQTIKALSLDNCLINLDMIITPEEKVHIIEVSGRPGGLNISSKIIPAALGIDYFKEGIQLALKKSSDFKPTFSKPVSFKFINKNFSEAEKKIMRKDNNVLEFSEFPIAPVRTIENGSDVMAMNFIMTTGANLNAAIENARKYENYIYTKN